MIGIVAQQAMAGGGTSVVRVDVTVPAEVISSDLENFPLYIDLSEFPSGFWGMAWPDGGNIRVRNSGGVIIPFDVAIFSPTDKLGTLFVKISLSSSQDTTVTVSLDGNGLLPFGSPNGRFSVWQDYEAVTLLGFDPRDRTGKNEHRSTGDANYARGSVVHTLTQDAHQGGTFDGEFHYIVDTNAIYKFDVNWNLVASNLNPIGDTGLPIVNHLGDPCNVAGKLFIPLEYYLAQSHSNQHIVTFNCSDLSFVESFDVSSVAREVSSICYCDRDDLFYVTDYVSDTVQKYSANFAHQGSLVPQYTIPKMQGIEWFKGAFWISTDEYDEVVRVEYDGQTTRNITSSTIQGLFGDPIASGNFEGIWRVNDYLYQLSDPSSSNSFVSKWEEFNSPLSAGAGYRGTNQQAQFACASFTTWTVGSTGCMRNKSSNRCLSSYWDHVGGSGNNDRASLGYQLAADSLGIWDDQNGWLFPSPSISPAIGEFFRFNARYDGVISRDFSVNGEVAAQSVGGIIIKSGLSALRIGSEDDDQNESWNGDIGITYLRQGLLSDSWLNAEYANLNRPTDFYEITTP